MPTVQLTNQMFLDEIFDYITEKDWKFKGNKPAIIDFYADYLPSKSSQKKPPY